MTVMSWKLVTPKLRGSEMTHVMLTMEGLAKINELISQNSSIRNRLDAAEKQRDELLEALENWINALDEPSAWMECRDNAKKAIAKAKGE